jgi:hypothetical protein
MVRSVHEVNRYSMIHVRYNVIICEKLLCWATLCSWGHAYHNLHYSNYQVKKIHYRKCCRILKQVIKHKTYTYIYIHIFSNWLHLRRDKTFQKTTEKKIGEYSTAEKRLWTKINNHIINNPKLMAYSFSTDFSMILGRITSILKIKQYTNKRLKWSLSTFQIPSLWSYYLPM